MSLNKLSNKDKAGMSLVCIRHCDCVWQFDGKHR
nr:MAG TPA: Transcription initiation factor IIA, gamma subunit [Caudoviricetes sp.]